MPTPKLDDNLLEYAFTVEEYKAARTLTPVQINYYHTLRAQMMKQRAMIPIPEDTSLNRSYICQCVELDGKINQLTELLDAHQAVIKELSDPNKHTNPEQGNELVDTTASRASALVNRTQT